jgi:hypothetical protein
MGVRPGHAREHRCIDEAQPVDPSHPARTVDHRIRVAVIGHRIDGRIVRGEPQRSLRPALVEPHAEQPDRRHQVMFIPKIIMSLRPAPTSPDE